MRVIVCVFVCSGGESAAGAAGGQGRQRSGGGGAAGGGAVGPGHRRLQVNTRVLEVFCFRLLLAHFFLLIQ